jgi:polysaccharide biosynthesis protein VpsQ
MIRIALVYVALLAALIVAADVGWLPRFAERLHDLPFGDKVGHFLMFGGLALVANLALASRGRRSLARAIVIGSILVLIVATAEEYSNKFVPMRDWSLGDLTANYLGVACLGVLPLWRRQPASRPRSGEPDDSLRPQISSEG